MCMCVFEGAQGAGFVQRKLAASIPMVHTITMNTPSLSAVRLQEKGGPLDTDNTLVFGAGPVKVKTGPREFMNSVSWEGDREDVMVIRSVSCMNDFEIVYKRYLEDSGKTVRMVATHSEYATKKDTTSTSWFQLDGPSPSTPPVHVATATAAVPAAVAAASDDLSAEGSSGAVATAASVVRCDLSGRWERVRTQNMDSYIGAQGAGFLQRKVAARCVYVRMCMFESIYFPYYA